MSREARNIRRTKMLLVIVFLSISIMPAMAQKKVSIGPASNLPTSLEVHGAVGTTTAIFGGDGTGISLQRNWPAVGLNQYYNAGSRYIANGYGAAYALDPVNGLLILDMYPMGNANAVAGGISRALTINSLGCTGIRHGSPQASLSVGRGTVTDAYSGSAFFLGTHFNSHFFFGNEEDVYIRGGMAQSSVDINVIPGNNHVGIGNGATHVGINTMTPGRPLEMRGRTGVPGHRIFKLEATSSNQGWGMDILYTNPDLRLYYMAPFNDLWTGEFDWSTGQYWTFSDARLKKNVEKLPAILEKIMLLEPVEYESKFNNPDHVRSIGFLAQSVKKLFPELVTINTGIASGYDGITDLHTVSYEGFGVIAVKGIQEQQEQLKEVRSLNENILERLKALEAKVKK